MSHAEKCPVCEGKGKLEIEVNTPVETCHGCIGKGWITVEDQGKMFGEPVPGDPPAYIPYYPSWPHPDPNAPYWYYHPTTWTYKYTTHTEQEDLT